MKPAPIHESEAGWGRKLDYMPAPAAVMAGALVGAAAGVAAALMAPWPGALVFAGMIALGMGLAARARAITVLMQPSVEPEPARPAMEPVIEAHEEQPPDSEPELAAEQPIDVLAMVRLDGGTFWMGSAEDDEIASSTEKPARLVQVSPFSCMKYPVTRRLWLEVMGAGHDWWPGRSADNRPVNNVSWYDAVRFCNTLSEQQELEPCYRIEGDDVAWVSSEGYRLPTEAEWEYACRASTRTRWSFGDDETAIGNFAWFNDNAGDQPRAVGLKQPNAWGLHDMHGNVWEWCWDWYTDHPEPSGRNPQVDPRGPGQESARALRGGSFADRAGSMRCAYRVGYFPEAQFRFGGFRCVRGIASWLRL